MSDTNHSLIMAMAERIYAQSELLSRKAEKQVQHIQAICNDRITNKKQMYAMLAAGRFGNTTQQWFDVGKWESESPSLAMWGVRNLLPGGRCRLFCPREEVRQEVASADYSSGYNISVMIDVATNVTLWAEVYDSDAGLLVYGIENPPKGSSWRELMPHAGRHWEGVQATMLLRRHLWPSSLSDLEALRDLYPGHVYEMSACEDAVGSMCDRNGIVWEVRQY